MTSERIADLLWEIDMEESFLRILLRGRSSSTSRVSDERDAAKGVE